MTDRPRAADLRTRLELPLNWNFRSTGYLAEARIVFQSRIYEALVRAAEVSKRGAERARPRLNLIYIVLLNNLMSNKVLICALDKDVLQHQTLMKMVTLKFKGAKPKPSHS